MREELEELNELASLLEDKELLEQNKVVSKLLFKKGIKIREHQWQELEAS